MIRYLITFTVLLSPIAASEALSADHVAPSFAERPHLSARDWDKSTTVRPRARGTVIDPDSAKSLRKTDSYKIYKKSDKQRTRIVDPLDPPKTYRLPGSPPKTSVPSGKIYRNSVGGQFGLR
ncbi:MAG: hypothetical protein QNI90_01600 [Dinoroseobacter sp.]|nr:hypothetical protein [Dinoroseobacter sp.]